MVVCGAWFLAGVFLTGTVTLSLVAAAIRMLRCHDCPYEVENDE